MYFWKWTNYRGRQEKQKSSGQFGQPGSVCKEVGLFQEQKRLVQLNTMCKVGRNSGNRQQQQQKEVEFVTLLQALSS